MATLARPDVDDGDEDEAISAWLESESSRWLKDPLRSLDFVDQSRGGGPRWLVRFFGDAPELTQKFLVNPIGSARLIIPNLAVPAGNRDRVRIFKPGIQPGCDSSESPGPLH